MGLFGLLQDSGTPSELPTSFFSALASHLNEALSSATASPIEALESELSVAMRRLLRAAHPDAIAAATGRTRTDSVADAFALGQINFAQQLTALAGNSRIEDGFLEALRASKFSPYLRELFESERSNKELSTIISHSEETVSRRMRELRAQGITDFRKDGTLVINFLTPVARQIMQAEKEAADEIHQLYLEPLKPDVEALMRSLQSEQPQHMKHALTFAATT